MKHNNSIVLIFLAAQPESKCVSNVFTRTIDYATNKKCCRVPSGIYCSSFGVSCHRELARGAAARPAEKRATKNISHDLIVFYAVAGWI